MTIVSFLCIRSIGECCLYLSGVMAGVEVISGVADNNRHMVARIQTDGLCRVTYGEVGGLSYEELKERQPGKFQAFLPGNPTTDKYELVNFSPYRVHQRCVDKMRVGRFLLAADAAHLCNPLYVGSSRRLEELPTNPIQRRNGPYGRHCRCRELV
jgi:hypothetical protein